MSTSAKKYLEKIGISFKNIVLMLFLAIYTACQTPSDIGEEFLPDDRSHAFVVDTVTVWSSTVRLDSIRTSNIGTLLLGSYADPKLGYVYSESYFRFSLPNSIPQDVDDDAAFDSLELLLTCKGVWGDTLVPFRFSTHLLAEELDFEEDESSFFNTSQIDYASRELARVVYSFPKEWDRRLQFRLSDQLGRQLFTWMIEESEIYQDLNDFQEAVRGIALVPDPQNKAVLQFSASQQSSDNRGNLVGEASPLMRIHYHIGDEEYTLDFPVSDLNRQFNRIGADAVGLPVSQIERQEDALSAKFSQEESYVQAGVGLLTRLDFPYIRDVYPSTGRTSVLLKAELDMYPVMGTWGNEWPLNNNLVLYYTNGANDPLAEITGTSSSGSQQVIQPTLVVDRDYKEHTYYRFVITEFMDGLMRSEAIQENALMIGMQEASYVSSVNRVVLGSQMHPKSKLKLRLYFARF